MSCDPFSIQMHAELSRRPRYRHHYDDDSNESLCGRSKTLNGKSSLPPDCPDCLRSLDYQEAEA